MSVLGFLLAVSLGYLNAQSWTWLPNQILTGVSSGGEIQKTSTPTATVNPVVTPTGWPQLAPLPADALLLRFQAGCEPVAHGLTLDRPEWQARREK